MAAARALVIADDPAAWAALGFACDADGAIALGPLVLRLAGRAAGEGIVALELDPAPAGDADGLPLRPAGPVAASGSPHAAAASGSPYPPAASGSPHPPAVAGSPHPNGAMAVDHLVALTPDRDRTADALAAVGGDIRRRGEPPELPAPMAFVRFGPLIVEVAATNSSDVLVAGGARTVPGAFPARWWGLTVTVADIDAAAAIVGVESRPAVQPGRRILTVPRSAGLSTALALMSP
jgi:hypothetical protein